MKKAKAFYLTLVSMVMIFTLAISSTTVHASYVPTNTWIPYAQGGYDVFFNAATTGDHGLHNMARAMISEQIHTNMNTVFSGARLGNQPGNSLNRDIRISTKPIDFQKLNNANRFGYMNHRGWSNVWQYQRNGNWGAGRHNVNENMAWFTEFADVTLTTNDKSVRATIRYINPTTLNVRLTRVTASSTNPTFTWHNPVSLPIHMSFNRWNKSGSRINDYHANDRLTIISNHGRGPFGAWDLRQYIR